MDKYQTIFPRLGALIIDGIILVPVGYFASFITFLFGTNPALVIISQFLTSAFAVFYTIMLHAKYGQTLGKMACGVKVIDISESDITLQQSIIRSSPQLIQLLFFLLIQASATSPETGINKFFFENGMAIYGGIFICWSLADTIVALADKEHRALHDFIAKTIVIKTK